MAYSDKTFLDKFKPLAIRYMRETGILASLTGAQGFIESSKGNSGLTKKANNLFGIKGKCNGESVRMLTTEYYNNVPVKVYADFRKYPDWQASINDHSSLFNRLKRYENLRGETNYVRACNNVAKDGYATSPTYATTLLDTINRYRMFEWDAEVLGRPVEEKPALSPGVYYPTLRRGDTGVYVLCWQKYLNLSGFPCGLEDGIFGKNTEIAVKEYQASRGLKPDGIIGKMTWNTVGN